MRKRFAVTFKRDWPVLRWVLLAVLIVLISGSILGLFDNIEWAGLGKKPTLKRPGQEPITME